MPTPQEAPLPLNHLWNRAALALFALALSVPALAEPIPIRQPQGATRGFLVIRSERGALLGHGEFSQLVSGDRVTSHLNFHFRDGSIDEETAVYTQKAVFQLVSDHHIQRGPFFSKPIDFLVEANGNVTLRSLDKQGAQKVETSHIDIPPDLSNGIISILLVNIRPDTPEFKLAMVAPTGKGRLIQLDIQRAPRQPFSCVVGFPCKATVFRIKPELGGLTGIVAPLIGKQPSDIFVWILEGDAPVAVREVGQLAEGGPVVSIELAGTIFRK